jgi:hypothetical protein
VIRRSLVGVSLYLSEPALIISHSHRARLTCNHPHNTHHYSRSRCAIPCLEALDLTTHGRRSRSQLSPRASSSPPPTWSMEDASNHHDIPQGPLSSPPPPPNPNANVPSLNPHFDNLSDSPVHITTPAWDITTLSALGALRTLQEALETLTEAAADVPPTPPISRPATPTHNKSANETSPPQPQPYIGADADPHDIQHAAIARRFFSKRPPPFSISTYLARQHAYCPHSPGVYLTAAHYIHRLCIVERVLPVTNRTVHRLSLAAVRIAAKALEDNKWSQQRVAQVGGVSPTQLLNLEVALCFLLDFELGVDAKGLAGSMFGLQVAGRSGGR